MNLATGEVADLPLSAALLDGHTVLATTPEWDGAQPGAVTYRARRACLVVNTGDAVDPAWGHLIDALLEELDDTARAVAHRQALRVRMLSTSLRVVVGRAAEGCGLSTDALEHACAGIAARTALEVSIVEGARFALLAPAVAALVLVQVAGNAERHDGATALTLRTSPHAFSVEWRRAGGGSRSRSARRRDDRARWGLGFARIAADSLGAVLHPPVDGDGEARGAILECGLDRLALPLALLRDGAVVKATRGWDEETSLLPGRTVPAGRVAQCVNAASSRPGTVVRVDGWSARQCARGTWVAIPPDGVVDRARDLLDGLAHERALWEGVPEPARSRIAARAAILGSLLGVPLERVPADTWNRRAGDVARAYGLSMSLPHVDGTGAVDPRIALFLAAHLGASIDADGDELRLHIRPDRRRDPLALALAQGGEVLTLR